jgi:hypothetical protein
MILGVQPISIICNDSWEKEESEKEGKSNYYIWYNDSAAKQTKTKEKTQTTASV